MTDNERPDNAPPEGQPHLGPTEDAKITGLPDEIDIEIAEAPEEGAEQPAAPAAEQTPQRPAPRRPRSDPQRRIDQLTGRLRETETNAERLARENRELLERLEGGNKAATDLAARAETAERAALIHHKSAETLKQQAAQRDLQAAIELGDAVKQADATARMTAAAAELNKIADWEAAHPAPKPGEQPTRAEPTRQGERPAPRQEQPRQVELAAPARAFIEENAAWFDPSGEDYDKEMRDEMVGYAYRYEQRLIAQGRQAEINSEPYFDKLRAHMRSEFPDYDWGDAGAGGSGGNGVTVIPAIDATTQPPTRQQAAQRQNATQNGRMPQMTRNNAVLPANGQAAPGAKPAGDRVQVQMSDAEKELAIGQWENGAMGNHFRTGKPVASREQAVEQWAYRKALAAKGGRAA